MNPFEMVVLIVFITTVGRAAVAIFGRGRRGVGGEARIEALEARARESDARLVLAEEQVAELSEKVLFMERLLEHPSRAGELPRGG